MRSWGPLRVWIPVLAAGILTLCSCVPVEKVQGIGLEQDNRPSSATVVEAGEGSWVSNTTLQVAGPAGWFLVLPLLWYLYQKRLAVSGLDRVIHAVEKCNPDASSHVKARVRGSGEPDSIEQFINRRVQVVSFGG